jgi:hypothetical protein
VRAAFRESGYNRLHILEEIADNPETTARDRIAAIDLVLEHGMRGNVTIDDVWFAVVRHPSPSPAAVAGSGKAIELLARKFRDP